MPKKFCPKCKSENVKIAISASAVLGVPQNWVCNICGYSNVVFPEKERLTKLKTTKLII